MASPVTDSDPANHQTPSRRFFGGTGEGTCVAFGAGDDAGLAGVTVTGVAAAEGGGEAGTADGEGETLVAETGTSTLAGRKAAGSSGAAGTTGPCGVRPAQ